MLICLGPLFNPQSPQTQVIANVFSGFLILSAAIFLVVAGLVSYALVRYRAREGAAEPRPRFGSRHLEITWTAVPLLIVGVLFVITVRTMAFVDAPQQPARAPDLVITSHQWWWDARYPNGAVASHEIHIPAGTRMLARIESADVIHDFWVPQLARKMDAVPGRPSYLWLEAGKPGTYQGACSEFCGMQHAWMRFLVIADSVGAFNSWLDHEATTPTEPLGGAAAEGARLYREKGCDGCHAIAGTNAATAKGPPLTHIAARAGLEGELRNTPQNLGRWIRTPQSIKPGNRMPDQQLSDDELQALTAYLETLR